MSLRRSSGFGAKVQVERGLPTRIPASLARAGQPAYLTTAPNQPWALDLVHDPLANGQAIRILPVVDPFPRECVALEADTCLPSRRVTRTLDQVISERGQPERIRRDNGSELARRHFLCWRIGRRIELSRIPPGKPVQNAFLESFNGRLRLNASWFRNL